MGRTLAANLHCAGYYFAMMVRLRAIIRERCCAPVSTPLRHGSTWLALLLGLLVGVARLTAAPYGIDTRPAIGPFLNNVLPPTAPDAASGWSAVPAFPN